MRQIHTRTPDVDSERGTTTQHKHNNSFIIRFIINNSTVFQPIICMYSYEAFMKMPTEEMQVEGKSLSFLVDSRVTHSVIKCAHLPNCEPSGLWQPASGGGLEQWGPFYVLLTTHTVASHLDPFVTVQGSLQITRRQHPPPERCLRHHRRPRGSPDTVHNNNVIFIVFIIAVQLLSPTGLMK